MPADQEGSTGTFKVRHRTAFMAGVLLVVFTLLPVLLGLLVAPWFFLVMLALFVVPFLFIIDAPMD